MLLLSIDSTDRGGSLALSDEDEVLELRYEFSERTHSARLMPDIEAMLTDRGFDFEDLTALAVATGPGSFTAIRLGVTTAKTLGEVCDADVVAASSLRVQAEYGRSHDGVTRSVIDARRGELYVQDFDEQLTPLNDPSLQEPDNFVAGCEQYETPLVIQRTRNWTPENLTWPDNTKIFPEMLSRPLAQPLTGIARRRLTKGQTDDRDRITPNYVRQSDAQRSASAGVTP